MKTIRSILRDDKGVTMVEFTAIAALFFALFLAIIEMGLAFYWWKSTEKAAQLGVRMAVVRTPAAPDVPLQNAMVADGVLGQPCRNSPSPCVDFGTVTCTGAGCTGEGFPMILTRMQDVFPVIGAENVRVSYAYVGLGYAGGTAVPAVSVTLTGIPFPFFMLGRIFELFSGDASAPATIPDIRSTLTAEDLSTSGG